MDYQYTSPYRIPYYPYFYTKVSEFFQAKYINYGSALFSSRTTTSYSSTGNNSITLTDTYSYTNPRYQLERKIMAQAVEEKYFYPEINPNGSTPAVIQNMVAKNIIAPIVNQVTKTGGKEVSGYKVDYKEFTPENTTVIMPEKLYELEDTTYVLSTQVLSYTKHGNPQEVVARDGVHTVYLWSYNYRHLIAEIKNTTLAQVSNAVQSVFGMSIEALAAQNPDVNTLKNLRNNANLNNALVTTYTYGPWRKVTSVTDPRGVTITYEHDSFGRLKTIKDVDDKKVEEYEYNYKK